MVNLDRCNRTCNTLDDPSNRICVPNKTKDVNLSVFNIITRINQSKTILKHENIKMHLMVENVIQIKEGITNVDVSAKS